MPARRTSNRDKELKGTDRPDRIRPELKLEPMTSAPEPPDWLVSPIAVEEFQARISDLLETGNLTQAKVGPLGHYANLHASMVKKWRAGMECTASEMTQMRLMAKDLHFIGGDVIVKRRSQTSPFEKFGS